MKSFSLKYSRVLVLASVCLGTVCAWAAPLKVLMIGNSYSICVLKHMPQVAKSCGAELDIASLYIGGCPMARHVQNIENAADLSYMLTWNRCGDDKADWPELAACIKTTTVRNHKTGKEGPAKRANICAALAADRWDIVTVQQASHFSFKAESYHPWGDKLLATVKKLAPQAKIYLQETWSDQPESKRLASWKFTSATMYAALHRCYADFAKENSLPVIPTGTAVEFARGVAPLQCAGGNPHLGPVGEYLQGLVWTAKIFGKDVTSCAYAPAGMEVAVATALKTAAMRAVKGELPASAEAK